MLAFELRAQAAGTALCWSVLGAPELSRSHLGETTSYSLGSTHPAYGQGSAFTGEQLTVLPSGLQRSEGSARTTTIEAQSGRILTDQFTQTVNGRSATTTFLRLVAQRLGDAFKPRRDSSAMGSAG